MIASLCLSSTHQSNRTVLRLVGLGALLLATLSATADSAPPYGLPSAQPETQGFSSKRLDQIQTMAQRFIDQGQLPGLVSVVARQGKVVHFSAQGYADIDKQTPMQTDTIFRMYSSSKIVNAVAVMMLYEEGHFLLNDPIAHYLPEFKGVKVYSEEGPVDPKRPITIQQLLTHSSGISTSDDTQHPVGERYRQQQLDYSWGTAISGITLAEFVKTMAALPLRSHPGDDYFYAFNMTVLARLVEVISGQRYSEFLQQRIFGPLGMVDTGFYVPANKLHRLAQLYQTNDQGKLINITRDWPWDTAPSLEMGDSGLVSTAHDYVRFSQMLLNGGSLDGRRYLSPTTVKLISSAHLPSGMGGFPGASTGLTVMVTENPAKLGYGFYTQGSYSWGGAAGTLFVIDPQQDLFHLTFTQTLKPEHLMGYRVGALVYQALNK